MRNKRQILGELRDFTSKSIHISAANRPKVEHLIPNKRSAGLPVFRYTSVTRATPFGEV